ncbi:MAG: transporter [Thermodesulfobacteriota bacterium]
MISDVRRLLAVTLTLLLTAISGSWASDESTALINRDVPISRAGTLSHTEATREDGTFRFLDGRLDYPSTWLVAQHPGVPDPVAAAADPEVQDLSYLSRELINPVTSLWSLTFQSNNFRLENDKWVYNLLFQPVLPVGITKNVSLITRPVLSLYNSVPVPTAPGEFEQTTGFGDMILLELFALENTGNWIVGVGPTFIVPTASKTATGQGKWQAGPALGLGYITQKWLLGVFPQQWWSFAGDSDRPETSQMNLQPFAALFFGQGWNIAYSGNILANWKAPSSERWTVPVGLGVGKVMRVGILPIRIQLAVQYMPVRPSEFGQEWNFQIQLTPVIPRLIKGTLF